MDSFFWVDCCPLEILHTISDDVLFQDLDSGHSISQAFLKILEALNHFVSRLWNDSLAGSELCKVLSSSGFAVGVSKNEGVASMY